MIIFTLATLKQIIRIIFEPTVKHDEIIKLVIKLKLSKLWIENPRIDENALINIRIIIVFKNFKFTRFRLSNIDIFIMHEKIDIRKYPIISEYVPKYLGKNIIHKINTAEEMAWVFKDFISRPIAFRIEDVICDNPKGIIIMLAYLRYMPAILFLKINSHIGSPRAMKLEIKIDENKRLVFIEKFIFDFKLVVSLMDPSSILFDNLLIEGIIVTARDPMRVVGIIKRGKVIPIRIPNSDKASAAEYP